MAHGYPTNLSYQNVARIGDALHPALAQSLQLAWAPFMGITGDELVSLGYRGSAMEPFGSSLLADDWEPGSRFPLELVSDGVDTNEIVTVTSSRHYMNDTHPFTVVSQHRVDNLSDDFPLPYFIKTQAGRATNNATYWELFYVPQADTTYRPWSVGNPGRSTTFTFRPSTNYNPLSKSRDFIAWSYLSGSYTSASNYRCWVDGERVGLTTGGTLASTNSTNGGLFSGVATTTQFAGVIDYLYVFDRVLTDGEVATIYADPAAPFLRMSRHAWFANAAAAGGLSIPVAMRSYRKRRLPA